MGAHASDTSLWWRRVASLLALPLRFLLHPYGAGLALGLFVGTILAVVLAHDLALAKGHQREHAVAMSVQDHDGFFDGCGKGSTQQTVRWQSANPPAGLPDTFVHEGCGDVVEGDRATIVRTANGSNLVVDPPASWAEVASAWFVSVVVCGVGGVVFVGASVIWRRMWRRRPVSTGRHERG